LGSTGIEGSKIAVKEASPNKTSKQEAAQHKKTAHPFTGEQNQLAALRRGAYVKVSFLNFTTIEEKR
jgi:hypothetical protein